MTVGKLVGGWWTRTGGGARTEGHEANTKQF